MPFQSLLDTIRTEKETDLIETTIDVIILMLGGVIGGKAFEVATSDNSLFYELGIYAGLLLIGVVCVYLIRLSKPIGDAIAQKQNTDSRN